MFTNNTDLALTPCFWIETFVRCTNMLSSSFTLALYLTVQKRQNPRRYLRDVAIQTSRSNALYYVVLHQKLDKTCFCNETFQMWTCT